MKRTVYLMRLCLVTVVLVLMIGNDSQVMASAETDSRIESSFNNSYVVKTYLKGDIISITSKDGVVTLTGDVAQENHKDLAGDTAAELPGVVSIDNQIQVKGDNSDKYSDSWIGVKVKTALLFHRNVSGTRTEVDVQNGIVTLRGTADSQAQKDLTTEYVKDVEGVRDVKNEMLMSPSDASKNLNQAEVTTEKINEPIDDASITAQVKWTLLAHRSTSGFNTQVKTNEGVVTLTGKAKNEAEKALAGKLASDIKGVRSVVNKIEIE